MLLSSILCLDFEEEHENEDEEEGTGAALVGAKP